MGVLTLQASLSPRARLRVLPTAGSTVCPWSPVFLCSGLQVAPSNRQTPHPGLSMVPTLASEATSSYAPPPRIRETETQSRKEQPQASFQTWKVPGEGLVGHGWREPWMLA